MRCSISVTGFAGASPVTPFSVPSNCLSSVACFSVFFSRRGEDGLFCEEDIGFLSGLVLVGLLTRE
jgi:hypothetical protein